MYNAEKYIEKCLTSILNSNLSKNSYEIIVIDDGSMDNSVSLVKKYTTQNSQIHLLEQENQGQSTARNNGIKKAQGEYIWFVDADDYLENNLTEVFDYLKQFSELDILAVQLKKVKEDGTFIKNECTQPAIEHNILLSGRNAIISGYNPSSVCALITKKELLMQHNLFFKEGMTHQDVELSLRLMAHAEEVYFSELIPYIYIIHPTSTSQSLNVEKKKKYLYDEILVMNSFKELSKEFAIKDEVLSQKIKQLVKNINLGLVVNLYNNRKTFSPVGINTYMLIQMRKAGYFPLKGNFGNLKKNIFSKIFNCYFNLFLNQ